MVIEVRLGTGDQVAGKEYVLWGCGLGGGGWGFCR